MIGDSKLLDSVVWTPVIAGDVIKLDTGNIPHVTHQGIFKVGGFEFRAYQLSDGNRILDADDVHKFFNLVTI